MNKHDLNMSTREALNEMAQRISAPVNETIVVPISQNNVHCVADMEHNRFVCLSNDVATVGKLKDAHPNFEAMYHIDKLPIQKTSMTLTSENCWRWYFDLISNRVMYGMHGELHSEKVMLYTLMQEKAAALDRIYTVLRAYRLSMNINMPLQDFVYSEKIKQAMAGEGCFLESYADVMNISIKEASDEIIFRHMLDMAKLNDSERLRLKFQNIIVKETSVKGVHKHLHAFEREARLNDNI
jgi:hypothetical protein